jgi:hypothetical protein
VMLGGTGCRSDDAFQERNFVFCPAAARGRAACNLSWSGQAYFPEEKLRGYFPMRLTRPFGPPAPVVEVAEKAGSGV